MITKQMQRQIDAQNALQMAREDARAEARQRGLKERAEWLAEVKAKAAFYSMRTTGCLTVDKAIGLVA
jgi:hypothetical protein